MSWQTLGAVAPRERVALAARTPGDEGCAEPYGYVSPWPYPEPGALPPFPCGGGWPTEGHTSAILTGSQLLEGPAESQAERLHDFLDCAVDASRRALQD